MLRNIFRTSRWLVRKQINICPHLMLRYYPSVCNIRTNEPVFRQYSSNSTTDSLEVVDQVTFEEICNETLESLCDYFEELIEQSPNLKGADVMFSVSLMITITYTL